MAIQFSTAVRNAQAAAIVSTIGAAPKMLFYSGTMPSSCAASATGTLLATLTLPSTWEGTASGGSEAEANGPWTGTVTVAGTIGYFRLTDSSGATVHMQGTVGQGTGDLSFDNPNVAVGQALNINAFTLTEANA